MQPMPLAGRNTTLEALISLVDEPDDTAFGVIRSRILTLGPDAIAPLEEVMDNSFDPLVRERLREIVGSLRMADLRDRLADWIATGSSNLLAGFILVSKTVQ